MSLLEKNFSEAVLDRLEDGYKKVTIRNNIHRAYNKGCRYVAQDASGDWFFFVFKPTLDLDKQEWRIFSRDEKGYWGEYVPSFVTEDLSADWSESLFYLEKGEPEHCFREIPDIIL